METEIHVSYALEVLRTNSFIVYPVGTPVLSIHTNALIGIRIYRLIITNIYTQLYDITKHFLRFQQRCRRRIYIKRHAAKWLRKRELRHVELRRVVCNLADLYTRGTRAPFTRLN